MYHFCCAKYQYSKAVCRHSGVASHNPSTQISSIPVGELLFQRRSDSVVTDSRTLMALSSTHQTHQTQSWYHSYGLLSSCSTASPESSSDITSVASSSTSSSFTASCSSFSLHIQKYTKGQEARNYFNATSYDTSHIVLTSQLETCHLLKTSPSCVHIVLLQRAIFISEATVIV